MDAEPKDSPKGAAPPPKTKRLHDLDPAEVSLVRSPANRRKFYTAKSADRMALAPDMLSHVRSYDLTEEGRERVAAVIQKAATADDGSERITARAQAALKATARILAPHVESLTAADLTALGQAVGLGEDGDDDEDDASDDDETEYPGDDAQRTAQGAYPKEEVLMADSSKSPAAGDIEMDMTAPDGVDAATHKAAMASAKSAYMAQMRKKDYNAKADDTDEDDEESPVEKSDDMVQKSADGADAFAHLSPEDRRKFEPIFKSHAELARQNRELVEKSDKLSQALSVERDSRVQKEMVAKAANYSRLGCDQTELANTLRGFLDRGDAAGMEQFERVLKAADTQLARGEQYGGLFSVAGTSQGAPRGAGAAEAKLQALADSLVAKGDTKLTPAQAYDKALESPEGRLLYAQYENERERAVGSN